MKKIIGVIAIALALTACTKEEKTNLELASEKRGYWKLRMVKETVGTNKIDTVNAVLHFISENYGEAFDSNDKDYTTRGFTWKLMQSSSLGGGTKDIIEFDNLDYNIKDYYELSNITSVHEDFYLYDYRFMNDYDYKYTGTIDKI
jgi:hypothetical protein